MKNIYSLFVLWMLSSVATFGQFSPQVGIEGHEGIHKDDSVFVNWASRVTIQRGYQDIRDANKGFANVGDEQSAVGPITAAVVSLGDGGEAIIEFPNPIANGEGADFAVFENGFLQGPGSEMAFLELAFVEVSSDGENFYRFPAISNLDNSVQLGGFANMNARTIHNFAGKHIGNYGTPFDLEELKEVDGLDVNHITHVKIIDVVGSIDPEYATYDSEGKIVNDPFPTPFGSSGFDLAGVGVIHEQIATGVRSHQVKQIQVYPNPAQETIQLENIIPQGENLLIYNTAGQVVWSGVFQTDQIDISNLKAGAYVGMLQQDDASLNFKFVKN